MGPNQAVTLGPSQAAVSRRLSNALADVKKAQTIIDEAGGYGFGRHLNGGQAIASAPKGSFPGIARQHHLLVKAGLTEPASGSKAQLAAVERFWDQWAVGGPKRPQLPLDRTANKEAIDVLQNAWTELSALKTGLLHAAR